MFQIMIKSTSASFGYREQAPDGPPGPHPPGPPPTGPPNTGPPN